MELFHLTLEGSFLFGRSSREKCSPESKYPISRGAFMLGSSCPDYPDPVPAPKVTEEWLVFTAAEVQLWVETGLEPRQLDAKVHPLKFVWIVIFLNSLVLLY